MNRLDEWREAKRHVEQIKPSDLQMDSLPNNIKVSLTDDGRIRFLQGDRTINLSQAQGRSLLDWLYGLYANGASNAEPNDR